MYFFFWLGEWLFTFFYFCAIFSVRGNLLTIIDAHFIHQVFLFDAIVMWLREQLF